MEDVSVSLAVRHFWENFPKAIEAGSTENEQGFKLRYGIFPHQAGYPHELQGGEQKTHEFAVYWATRRPICR